MSGINSGYLCILFIFFLEKHLFNAIEFFFIEKAFQKREVLRAFF
jgi:hypothetical protein